MKPPVETDCFRLFYFIISILRVPTCPLGIALGRGLIFASPTKARSLVKQALGKLYWVVLGETSTPGRIPQTVLKVLSFR